MTTHKPPILPWFIAIGWCGLFALLLVAILASLPDIGDMLEKTRSESSAGGTFLVGLKRSLPPPKLLFEPAVLASLSLTPSEQKKETFLVASIIENHEDARHVQKGLRDAAIVFECFVEGDITRFLALFRTDRLPETIGPVRSLREHFVSIAAGYMPLLLHAGGHPKAYEALQNLPLLAHHDGIRYDGTTFERDPEGIPPHNLFMRRSPLQALIERTKLAPFVLPFFQHGTITESQESEYARKISVNMGSPVHDVTYVYKGIRDVYARSVSEAPRQAQPSTVAILEATVEGYREKGAIPWTQTFGGGKLLLFRNGEMFRGRWQREKGKPFRFFDATENTLPVSTGQVWVTMLPNLGMVEWE